MCALFESSWGCHTIARPMYQVLLIILHSAPAARSTRSSNSLSGLGNSSPCRWGFCCLADHRTAWRSSALARGMVITRPYDNRLKDSVSKARHDHDIGNATPCYRKSLRMIYSSDQHTTSYILY
ncbi:uncharacterized protein BO97DRAFT_145200 [Aspergillus homomorphus CBS 101889]|uniref:Uncharacterized protein n=1 Tax=Aspergillus homomorphus (strain CBS 101889) TaxID=1450537 RepID=A0A395HRP6_ASPHC|nr:hypothetical protein BO97DRAFT_145200 [Aspergillus homomorphus CBS 101889]RAL10015.1 hypothetical protein BO97DRAFT_145200 [Aspergillus homomorphus CBS 101889]